MTPDTRSRLRAMIEDLEQRAAEARLQADLLLAESEVASIDDEYAAAVARRRAAPPRAGGGVASIDGEYGGAVRRRRRRAPRAGGATRGRAAGDDGDALGPGRGAGAVGPPPRAPPRRPRPPADAPE